MDMSNRHCLSFDMSLFLLKKSYPMSCLCTSHMHTQPSVSIKPAELFYEFIYSFKSRKIFAREILCENYKNMSLFFNLEVWVPVTTVLVVLVASGLIIVLVLHLRKRRQRRSIKRNSEAELVINLENPYSKQSLPRKESLSWENEEKDTLGPRQCKKSHRLTSDTSEGLYENYLFE